LKLEDSAVPLRFRKQATLSWGPPLLSLALVVLPGQVAAEQAGGQKKLRITSRMEGEADFLKKCSLFTYPSDALPERPTALFTYTVKGEKEVSFRSLHYLPRGRVLAKEELTHSFLWRNEEFPALRWRRKPFRVEGERGALYSVRLPQKPGTQPDTLICQFRVDKEYTFVLLKVWVEEYRGDEAEK